VDFWNFVFDFPVPWRILPPEADGGNAKEGRAMKAEPMVELGWMGWTLVLLAAAGIVVGGAFLGIGTEAGRLAGVIVGGAFIVTRPM
jgi:hypothetical protein